MNENQKTLFIRISYWIGVIMDAFFAIDMFLISLTGSVSFLSPLFTASSYTGTSYRYAMGVGAALMFGWTFLLIWADRKPIERRDIFILTCFPVVVVMMYSNALATSLSLIQIGEFIFRFVVQIGLIVIFLLSYFFAKSIE